MRTSQRVSLRLANVCPLMSALSTSTSLLSRHLDHAQFQLQLRVCFSLCEARRACSAVRGPEQMQRFLATRGQKYEHTERREGSKWSSAQEVAAPARSARGNPWESASSTAHAIREKCLLSSFFNARGGAARLAALDRAQALAQGFMLAPLDDAAALRVVHAAAQRALCTCSEQCRQCSHRHGLRGHAPSARCRMRARNPRGAREAGGSRRRPSKWLRQSACPVDACLALGVLIDVHTSLADGPCAAVAQASGRGISATAVAP